MNMRLRAVAKNFAGQGWYGSRICRDRQAGFTLVELMIAVTVLAVGMSGAIVLLLMGIENDSRSKTDTTATVLDQEIIELYSTLKTYPQPTPPITITDCATTNNTHKTDLGQGLGLGHASVGAVLYTTATAPLPAQVGDINWTVAAPTLATATQTGYAMQYQTCDGNIYEVRWNITDLDPNPAVLPNGTTPTSRLSLLTVSARPRSAAGTGAANQAILYAQPVTLRSMIED